MCRKEKTIQKSSLRWSLAALLLLGVASCQSPAGREAELTAAAGGSYFSLQEYFNQEIQRHDKEAPILRKTVEINGERETKTTAITNWRHELTLFAEADINKSAWSRSYERDCTAERVIYRSLDPELKTQLIEVHFTEAGAVRGIRIENQVNNWIFKSKEELSYYPDSIYEIRKIQDIRVVGQNSYRVHAEWQSE